MSADPVERIARTLLYEGYLLYPYRRSALKNQRPFNFGLVYPRDSWAAKTRGDRWQLQTQCVVHGGVETALHVSLRFLQVAAPDASSSSSDQPHAIEQEVELQAGPVDLLLRGGINYLFEMPASEPLRGVLAVTAEPIADTPSPGTLVTVRLSNVTPSVEDEPESHDDAVREAFVSTHVVLTLTNGGEFISLIDPPDAWRAAAGRCQNAGVWPVLVGSAGATDRMLASPIILYDYPQIAEESTGDLFDGTEIDEILGLRILTMTDEEKREIRESDPRARQILERTEALSPEHWQRLHGAVRGLRHVNGRTS